MSSLLILIRQLLPAYRAPAAHRCRWRWGWWCGGCGCQGCPLTVSDAGWGRAICPAILGAFSAWHPLSASCTYSKRERYSRYSKAASSAFLGHPGESPCGRIHIMTIMRITVGINKTEDDGTAHGQIISTDALARVPNGPGRGCQSADFSVTFLNEATGRQD